MKKGFFLAVGAVFALALFLCGCSAAEASALKERKIYKAPEFTPVSKAEPADTSITSPDAGFEGIKEEKIKPIMEEFDFKFTDKSVLKTSLSDKHAAILTDNQEIYICELSSLQGGLIYKCDGQGFIDNMLLGENYLFLAEGMMHPKTSSYDEYLSFKIMAVDVDTGEELLLCDDTHDSRASAYVPAISCEGDKVVWLEAPMRGNDMVVLNMYMYDMAERLKGITKLRSLNSARPSSEMLKANERISICNDTVCAADYVNDGWVIICISLFSGEEKVIECNNIPINPVSDSNITAWQEKNNMDSPSGKLILRYADGQTYVAAHNLLDFNLKNGNILYRRDIGEDNSSRPWIFMYECESKSALTPEDDGGGYLETSWNGKLILSSYLSENNKSSIRLLRLK